MFSWNKKSSDTNPSASNLANIPDEQRAEMLKIFNNNSENDSQNQQDSTKSSSSNLSSNSSSKGGKGDIFDRFDPTGLERAAKAARELQEFKFAAEAIGIANEQERTKQQEAAAKIQENVTRQKMFDQERVRVQEEERRKTIEVDKEAKQQQAYYQDQLARKRHQDQINAQRSLREEDLKRQEESQMRIEALRRQTAEYEARIRKETEQARVEAESKGRIEQERKNWDLHMQRARFEQVEFRKTVMEGIQAAGSVIGEGFRNYLSDRDKLTTTIGFVTLTALGIYTARATAGLSRTLLEARLTQPPLIRETSRLNISGLARRPIFTVKNYIQSLQSVPRAADGEKTETLKDIVLAPTLAKKLNEFVVSTRNVRNNRAQYRNMLLYGKPGTGKTLFAKQLARSVGMNYAIMTGSDVLPLGKKSVTEIHKLFDWAEKSRRGLVLFIDEAEAFLRKRSELKSDAPNSPVSTAMSEENRNALNAFLYRTGGSSNKFMLIFATNQPDQLDWAINDRTDEMVEFALPGVDERQKILELYFDKLIINGHKTATTGLFGMFGGPKIINVEEFGTTVFRTIAEKLEGFSGREINKLVVAWQAAARSSADCRLTAETMLEIVDERIKQHKQRMEWEVDHA